MFVRGRTTTAFQGLRKGESGTPSPDREFRTDRSRRGARRGGRPRRRAGARDGRSADPPGQAAGVVAGDVASRPVSGGAAGPLARPGRTTCCASPPRVTTSWRWPRRLRHRPLTSPGRRACCSRWPRSTRPAWPTTATSPHPDRLIAARRVRGRGPAGRRRAWSRCGTHRVRSLLLTHGRGGGDGRRGPAPGAGSRSRSTSQPQDVMNGVVGFNIHRGCLALAERPAARRSEPLGPGRPPAACWCSRASTTPTTSAASSAPARRSAPTCVVLGPGCGDPLYRKAIRTSMAATLSLPYRVATPWPDALATFRQAGRGGDRLHAGRRRAHRCTTWPAGPGRRAGRRRRPGPVAGGARRTPTCACASRCTGRWTRSTSRPPRRSS